MTLIKITALSVLVAGLAACAGTGASTSHEREMKQLAADCRDKGGVLQPTGAVTSNPGAEYACVIP